MYFLRISLVKCGSQFPLKYFFIIEYKLPTLTLILLCFMSMLILLFGTKYVIVVNACVIFFSTPLCKLGSMVLIKWHCADTQQQKNHRSVQAFQHFRNASFISFSTYPDQLKNDRSHKNEHTTEQSSTVHTVFISQI